MKVTDLVVKIAAQVITSLGNVKINQMLPTMLFVLLVGVSAILPKIVWAKRLEVGVKVPKQLWTKSICL